MTNSIKTHTLDPATINFLNDFAAMFQSLDKLPLPEQRSTIKRMFRPAERLLEPIAEAENKEIPGKHGSINLRLLYPETKGTLPIIVFFHRGGWVYGSLEESELICRKLANLTGAIIAIVDYPLSPEHKFPIALEECHEAAQWLVKNASHLKVKGDPKKVVLCGESAGGNLAAAVALKARDEKTFTAAGQLLLYPVLTCDLDKKHYDESPDKILLSYENMEFFIHAYTRTSRDKENPYVAPLKSKNFADLPPCLIITAQYDALKHEGERYAENLEKAGTKVESKCYPEVIHGFLDLPLADPVKEKALQDIAMWVKKL